MARKSGSNKDAVSSNGSGSNDGLSFKGNYPDKYLINRWKVDEVTARPEWQAVIGEPDLPAAMQYSRPCVYLFPIGGPWFHNSWLSDDFIRGGTSDDPTYPGALDSLVVNPRIDDDIASGMFNKTIEANRFRLQWREDQLRYYIAVIANIIMQYHSLNNAMGSLEERIPRMRDLEEGFGILEGFANFNRAVTDKEGANGEASRETTAALMKEIRLLMQDFVLPSGMQTEFSQLLQWHRAGTFEDAPIIGYFVRSPGNLGLTGGYPGWHRPASNNEIPFIINLYNLVVEAQQNRMFQRIAANLRVWLGDGHVVSLPESPMLIGGNDDSFLDHWANSGWINTGVPRETDEADETIVLDQARVSQNVRSFDQTSVNLVTYGALSDETLLRLVVGNQNSMDGMLNFYLSNHATPFNSARPTTFETARIATNGRVYGIDYASDDRNADIAWANVDTEFVGFDTDDTDTDDYASEAFTSLLVNLHHARRAKLGMKSIIVNQERGEWLDGVMPLVPLAGELEYVDSRLLRASLLRKWRSLAGLSV